MKKTLSLILAALMCAAMTPAVMAEEVTEVPAAAEEVPAVVEVLDAVAIVVDAEAVAALAAEYGAAITPEAVNMIVNSGIELTAENIKLVAATLNVVLPDEFVAALIELIASTPMLLAEEEVVEVEAVVEEVTEVEAVVEEIAEEAIVEEVVEEEAHKYPPVFEEIPTFGLFSKFRCKFLFRG